MVAVVTEVLAGAGGASAVCLVVIVWLTYKLVRSKDEQLAARDMLDKERERADAAEGDLKAESAAHVVTRDELRKEKYARAEAEAQRNAAHMEERNNVVAIIEKSNLADAALLVSRILAAPLPGASDARSGVSEAVPEGRATAPGPDRLLPLDL